jgi:hypothetical protein
MLGTALACLLLVVVVLKYLKPFGQRCPQCNQRREDAEVPICAHCGWIYEVPGEDDEDYVDDEEETKF